MSSGRFTAGDVLIAAAVFTGVLLLVPFVELVSAHFAYEEWYLLDEGTIAYAGFLSSLGELPHIAFPYFYSGGFEIVLGLIFGIFEATFGVARWTLGVCMAFSASMIFLICIRLNIDHVMAVIVSFVAVAVGFGMNFHIYPAWIAGSLVLFAIPAFAEGIRKSNRRLVILAGLFLALATMTKQNVGILSGMAFALFLPFSAATRLVGSGQGSTEVPPASLLFRFGVVLALPAGVFALLFYLVRAQLTLLNMTMFLFLPLLAAITASAFLWSAARSSAEGCRGLVRFHETHVLSLAAGVLIGVLPMLLVYASQGGLANFVSESFLSTQQVFSKRYSVFKFADEVTLQQPLVFIRRLALYMVPLLAVVMGFVPWARGINLKTSDPARDLLLLNSLVIMMLYFTLYPIANRVYILYMMPMILLPFGFGLDRLMKRRIASRITRAIVLVGLLLSASLLYITARQSAGDLHEMIADEVALLHSNSTGIYAPREVVNYIQPVVDYLNSRPERESFLAYDIYNKAVAFMTRRRTDMDFGQRHYYDELNPRDFQEIHHMARQRQVEVIVIGKKYLGTSVEERELFTFLTEKYDRVLDNATHLVYQRK